MKFKNLIALLKGVTLTCALIFTQGIIAQEKEEQQLDEVLVTSSRIDLPLSENSRTITVISVEEIQKVAATNLADLLQSVAGVDVRRRGANGQQADLYIRGGGFDQTLLLIDGVKVEDPQTGHHTLNMALPLELIERIEIVKGPSARVFGQNAFTGAINIVTKKNLEGTAVVELGSGSYRQLQTAVTYSDAKENKSTIAHLSRDTSDGYRHNTDFQNINAFVKHHIEKGDNEWNVLGSYTDRDFGANGFYASPAATEQYEATQASLFTVYGKVNSGNWVLKPSFFWKRNLDEYIYIRDKPSIYRNVHISNKVGGSLNSTYYSDLGATGIGFELSRIFIASNNLGGHQRTQFSGFVEQQMNFGKFDITPGIAVNYYSDFKFHAFPGVDFGFRANENLKVYVNFGYTYRIPTYTDLYYASSTTIGNAELNPETAFSTEIGAQMKLETVLVNTAYFRRDTENLIDYVKYSEAAKWQAENFAALGTEGYEIEAQIPAGKNHFQVGYTYIFDEIKDVNVPFSKYAINSMKNQVNFNAYLNLSDVMPFTLSYRFAERTDGYTYSVVDAALRRKFDKTTWSLVLNNALNAVYTETSLVPAPGRNFMLNVSYKFD